MKPFVKKYKLKRKLWRKGGRPPNYNDNRGLTEFPLVSLLYFSSFYFPLVATSGRSVIHFRVRSRGSLRTIVINQFCLFCLYQELRPREATEGSQLVRGHEMLEDLKRGHFRVRSRGVTEDHRYKPNCLFCLYQELRP
jgi:hypothetical protein